MHEMFVVDKYTIILRLIFVVRLPHENILIANISQITVYLFSTSVSIYMYKLVLCVLLAR